MEIMSSFLENTSEKYTDLRRMLDGMLLYTASLYRNEYSTLAEVSIAWNGIGNFRQCTDPYNSTDSRLLTLERFLEVQKVYQS